jgi:hypothetical protein
MGFTLLQAVESSRASVPDRIVNVLGVVLCGGLRDAWVGLPPASFRASALGYRPGIQVHVPAVEAMRRPVRKELS